MKCPNCRKQISAAHLRESPECAARIQSFCGMLNVSKRKTNKAGPGRPKKVQPQEKPE